MLTIAYKFVWESIWRVGVFLPYDRRFKSVLHDQIDLWRTIYHGLSLQQKGH